MAGRPREGAFHRLGVLFGALVALCVALFMSSSLLQNLGDPHHREPDAFEWLGAFGIVLTTGALVYLVVRMVGRSSR